MTNFRPIFENDWCGIETFLKDVLSPVFPPDVDVSKLAEKAIKSQLSN